MEQVSEIEYFCSADRSMQKAMAAFATGEGPRPLLVALHTWSMNYSKGYLPYADLCRAYDWHFIFPNFRGPNIRPEACGSDAVISDLADAVAYMRQNAAVEDARIYLTGGSGGGHCSLLAAARLCDIWAAVSAWCPISDLAAWHRQCRNHPEYGHYATHIEQVCGGDPQTETEPARQARHRSPRTYLTDAAAAIPLEISAGIHDGHIGSVPVSQSIHAYNLLAAPQDRIAAADIDRIVRTETVPAHLRPCSPLQVGGREVHLRKTSGNVRLMLFEGGHDQLDGPTFFWLNNQRRGRPVDWSDRPESVASVATALTH